MSKGLKLLRCPGSLLQVGQEAVGPAGDESRQILLPHYQVEAKKAMEAATQCQQMLQMPEEEEFANYAIVEVNQLGALSQELSIQAQQALSLPPPLFLSDTLYVELIRPKPLLRSQTDTQAGRQTGKSLYLQKLWLVCYLIILMKNSGEPRTVVR